MSSRQATRLTFSLEVLSSHSAAPGKSREGWGVAFYAGNDVALFREPGAASESPLVRHFESGGPRTTLAISHIRHATQGAVSMANTQPFVRELAGSAHVFAHNGDLLGAAASRILVGDRYRPMGTTDSELAFCALLDPPPDRSGLAGSAGCGHVPVGCHHHRVASDRAAFHGGKAQRGNVADRGANRQRLSV